MRKNKGKRYIFLCEDRENDKSVKNGNSREKEEKQSDTNRGRGGGGGGGVF